MFDKFSERHIGVSNEKELKAMLETIGVKSVDELISQVIPHSIRLKKPLALPAEGMSEYEFAGHIRALAERNRCLRSFIGMGYYPCAVPAAVTRNVFENPAWYTSYTPYQAEMSQGRLEALLNFQTAVISLTGMEIGNCSLLDEATAAAEAMLMMFALRSREAVREGRNQLFVDRNIFPQTLDVLLTRSEPFGIELIVDEYDEYSFTGKEFGAIVQYPAANGAVRDYADFTAAAHAKGALVTAVADLLAEKYLSTFLPLLPPNTDPADFKPVFIEAFRNMPMLHDRLSGEVKSLAGSYLTELKVQDVTYDIGKIDIGGDVVDMLCENLDSEGTPNPKNTLHLYGSITSALPVSLRLVPYFSPTNVRFDVTVEPGKTNEIRETQLFESDLRQIIEGAEIILPVSLEKYYPGYDFTSDQQIVITLRLIKRGGLKLNL